MGSTGQLSSREQCVSVGIDYDSSTNVLFAVNIANSMATNTHDSGHVSYWSVDIGFSFPRSIVGRMLHVAFFAVQEQATN